MAMLNNQRVIQMAGEIQVFRCQQTISDYWYFRHARSWLANTLCFGQLHLSTPLQQQQKKRA